MNRRRNALFDRLLAVVRWPGLHRLAAELPAPDLGRPRHHPFALHLAYGAAARLYRSCLAADRELGSDGMWAKLLDTFNETATATDTPTAPTWCGPMTAHHYRYGRDHLISDDNLAMLRDGLTREAVTLAETLGLLLPTGPGSLTHPHRSRAVYGDGTVVRPLYRPKPDEPNRRQDRDAAEFHRHDGPIHGNDFVALCARGDEPHQRIVLSVGRVDEPGHEAATALALVDHLMSHTRGVQAFVYDGALRGVHIEQLMTRHGLVVINKVAKRPGGKLRELALGTVEHPKRNGRRCRHELIARNGSILEVAANDAGDLTTIATATRHQVKRFRRPGGGYRFSLGITVPCRHGDFVAWLSPHPEPGDTTNRRPENVRLLPEADPDFPGIYGLRNDSESLNSQYKRTLLVDRAASLGWRRQLLDFTCFAILQNATAHAAMKASTVKASERASCAAA